MNTVLIVFQTLLAVALTVLIFLQSSGTQNSRANIMSTTNFQKRGWERVMFFITIGVLVLFLISSIIQTLI